MSYGVRGDETKRRSVGISIMQMVVDSGVYCGLCKLLNYVFLASLFVRRIILFFGYQLM